jgi:two-component system, chemotaxis family, chemotaxis protein CheY
MNQDAKTALVVEDDPLNREMVVTLLEDRGYAVFPAEDGDDGLTILEKNGPVDVVISDIFMPKREGVSFIRALRSRYPDVKVVAITGAVNYEAIFSTAQEFGADITIRKPFDIDVFGDKVDALIKG